ncbi:uncharacterized protein PRCAT00000230001 [Priceomyces carsonii]|uniref:uncharacterized protein n=1 Tax=Priceomyces carsonii TaxID=28549 RepID=UPI002EDA9ADA|nr:unnamed protein product [Priceomyces carsonii]
MTEPWKTTNEILLKNAPTKEVTFGWDKESSTFKLASKTIDVSDVKDGQFIAKVIYLSNDPTQRGWMQRGADSSRMYTAPIVEGDVIKSAGIAEVVYSKSPEFKVGDKFTGSLGWQEYKICDKNNVFAKIDESKNVPPAAYLGPFGLNGLTAYFGLIEVGKLKKGQTVVISAASGATGSLCVQIAKHIIGASKVIGLTSSDEKCKWVKSLGADECFNSADEDYKKKLTDVLGEDYVDVYFDNVGGQILSFMLTKVKQFGHVVACGSISGYNDGEKLVVHNWGQIITNRLTVRGFIVMDFSEKFPEALGVLTRATLEKKISISGGVSVLDVSKSNSPLKEVPEIWGQLFNGKKPHGKLITKIA